MNTQKETVIAVRGLEKSFGDIHVLRGIDYDIKKGEVVCVIGPSGSGKSTFLRCMNLLEEPTGGQILFDGVDITKKKIRNDEDPDYCDLDEVYKIKYHKIPR